MTSQLASQLQKLQVRPDDDKRLSESFLFSKSDARSFSREQIHQLATAGLQTLVTLDNRFHPFISTLFDPLKTRQERKLLHAAESKALDAAIEHFLALLSPHLFLTAAQQVFEYLVRVHEVHVYNVQAVLRAFLPYHDHNIFSRALLLLDLRDSGFDFLQKNQERGAPLLRDHLILACAESRKALRLVCLLVAMPARMGVHNSAANALFASVATALSRHADAEALWRVLLPFVVELLHGSEPGQAAEAAGDSFDSARGSALAGQTPRSREVTCTALLVLATWSGESRFSLQMMVTVMKPILAMLLEGATASGAADPLAAGLPLSDLLTLVDLLFATQREVVRQVGFAPLLGSLLAAPWDRWERVIAHTITGDSAGASATPLAALLSVLMETALERLKLAHSMSSVPSQVLHFLRCAAEQLPLPDRLVQSFLTVLIQCEARLVGAADATGDSNHADPFIADAVAALERRFQRAFDATLTTLLSNAETAGAAKAFLAVHLGGTRYQMLEVPAGGGGRAMERLPLFACLLHTVPAVRRAAALALEGMPIEQLCSTSAGPSSSASGGGGSLLELLAHTARYESDEDVCLHFLQAAAAALRQLKTALNEHAADEENGATAAPAETTQSFRLAAVDGLLRSLHAMSSAQPPLVQRKFFELALTPFLAGTVGTEKGKGARRNAPAGPETEGAAATARQTALYHATLLYVGAAVKLSAAAGDEELRLLTTEVGERMQKLFPDLARTAAVLAPEAAAAHGPTTGGRKRKENSSSSSSDEEEEGEVEGRAAKGRTKPVTASRTRTTASSPRDGEGGKSFFAVLDHMHLLTCIAPVARARLPVALSTARALLTDVASTAAQQERCSVECAVAAAAAVATPTPTTTSAPSTVPAHETLYRFLVGAGGESLGYLQLLQMAQREQTRRALNAGDAKAAVGRGAANGILSAAYLPANGFTRLLAAAVHGALRLALSFPTAATPPAQLVVQLRLLGYLGVPLPPLASNVQVLPAALLRLADEPAGPTGSATHGQRAKTTEQAREKDDEEEEQHADRALRVDWYGLVQEAVYGPAGLSAEPKKDFFSPGALAACVLLPLRAPPSQRLWCLQQLQSAVLQGAAARSSTASVSSVTLVVAAATAHKSSASDSLPTDVTTLSSVIEAMAKPEARFSSTPSGVRLLCLLLAAPALTQKADATESVGTVQAAVPYRLACDAVEYFCSLPESTSASGGSSSSSSSKRASKATLDLAALWPRVAPLLRRTVGARPAKKSSASTGAALSPAAADFVEAVCRRCVVQPSERSGTTKRAVAEEVSVQLCVTLLQRPFLPVEAGASATRPVYRHALTALASALQRGLHDAGAVAGSVIFRQKDNKAGRLSARADAGAEAAFASELAMVVSPVLMTALDTIGHDAARLCTGTIGGYERLFRPFLRQCAASSRASGSAGLRAHDAEAMVALLDALAPTPALVDAIDGTPSGRGDTHWQPPNSCGISNPLSFADACSVVELTSAAGRTWSCTPESLRSLRVLSALLRASPTVRYDDDEQEESLLALVNAVLAACPLEQMLPMLLGEGAGEASPSAGAALATLAGGSNLLEVYPRQVLRYLGDLVELCVEQPHALAEKDARGPYKLRGAVLKQSLVLMASLLLTDGEDDGSASAEARAALSRSRVDVIAELLRTMAPLLGPAASTHATTSLSSSVTAAAVEPSPSFLLHIPIAALLVRLESAQFTAALRYKSAADTCRDILTSFDINTQMSTVRELMLLVVDPHKQLSEESAERSSNTAAAAGGSDGGGDDGGNAREVLHLFRKLVKPNQIINRQEELLDVITTTVKSDAFLAPFIQLQHASGRAEAGKKEKDNEAADEDAQEKAGEAAQDAMEGTHASDACVRLLLAALEMFSHYSDLNAQTADDTAVRAGASRAAPSVQEEGDDGERRDATASATTAVVGERKGYTMLLELLSGNALACVLAGINEPTFVKCQLRLLGDSRTSVQMKGLEVLLDRLHHSLPTLENTLSDAEVEQHRKDLRDPKKKLVLADLVRIKARPLTTKRSFLLMPDLATLFRAALHGALAMAKKPAGVALSALTHLHRVAQLSAACVEELARIVASGGSTQAEKTLLNTSRSKRLTETQLSKLFGTKARVTMVHDFMRQIYDDALPGLTLGLQSLLRSARSATVEGGVHADGYALRAAAEEGMLATQCGLLTALGTLVQTMGTGFASAHSIALLNSITAALAFQVADLPVVIARAPAGSLLRHATLSCLVRVFPACWQLSQPYLPRIIFAATHNSNVDDPETSYLCTEVLAVLEALMEPQLFLEGAADCLRGMTYTNTAVLPGSAEMRQKQELGSGASTARAGSGSRVLRVQSATHSYVLLFNCIGRRLQSLKKEELLQIGLLMEGSTAKENFWLAALQSLTGTANAAPTAEVVQPVLDAFSVFFLKFKPKHCTHLLRMIAEWAFSTEASKPRKGSSTAARADKADQDSNSDGAGDSGDDERETSRATSDVAVPRTTIHRWLLFYALLNHLLERLSSILDFAFPVVLPYVVGTLQTYSPSSSSAADGHSSGALKPLSSLIALVLEGALDSVRRMSLAQSPGPDYDYSIPLDVLFCKEEVFASLMPAVVRQLANTTLLSDDVHDYLYRTEHFTVPAVRALFSALHVGKLQGKTQTEILRVLRHPNRRVRRMALACLDGIYVDGGEELASRLMAEMLPSVVELTEDPDEGVVEEARKLCTNLSHMTGQDVLHAMS